MTITASHLISSSSGSTLSSYATASITPHANRLALALIGNRVGAGTPDLPTCSGDSLTWVQVATAVFSLYRVTLFRAMGGSPVTGAVTFDFGGVSQQEACWSISEFDGVDTSGSNGSGAVVQSATAIYSGDGAHMIVTLAAFANANNATYGGFMQDNIGMTFTPATGFTVLGSDGGGAGGVTAATEWNTANATTVELDSSPGFGWEGLAVEIGAAASVTPAIPGGQVIARVQSAGRIATRPQSIVM